MNSSVLKGIW